ncbi:hypothetical protein GCM10027018_14270 [Paenibacillus thermoaerophilus]
MSNAKIPASKPSVRASSPDSFSDCGNKPKVEAETMIPAVKAIRISFRRSDNALTKKSGKAPNTVAIADMKLPTNATVNEIASAFPM